MFGRVSFILETIKGSHLNTYTGGFWYLMCTRLSGTPQKQANSYFMTLKISRISRFVYIFKLIYRLTMVKYSFITIQPLPMSSPALQTKLLFLTYIHIRMINVARKNGRTLSPLWWNTWPCAICNLIKNNTNFKRLLIFKFVQKLFGSFCCVPDSTVHIE